MAELALRRIQAHGQSVAPTAEAAQSLSHDEAASKEAAAAAPSLGSGLWQAAAENVGVHAVVLQHMCQKQGADAHQQRQQVAIGPVQSAQHHVDPSAVSGHAGLRPADTHSQPATHTASSSRRASDRSAASSSSSSHTSSGSHCLSHTRLGPASTAGRLISQEDQSDLPEGTSQQAGVRSAAHQRLEQPRPCNAKQAISQQRHAATYGAVLQAAPAVLQDMAVNIAEAVAACCLAQARSGPQGELLAESLDLLHNS